MTEEYFTCINCRETDVYDNWEDFQDHHCCDGFVGYSNCGECINECDGDDWRMERSLLKINIIFYS